MVVAIAKLFKINKFEKKFIMTTTNLKIEINKAIDNVPEEVLVDILDYLKQIKVTPKEKIDLSRHLGLILREDIELLQRLAF